jgi:hypothetical protein
VEVWRRGETLPPRLFTHRYIIQTRKPGVAEYRYEPQMRFPKNNIPP